MSVSWNRPSVMEGRISALIPDQVRKPVLHQPSCTVSPRPKEGSQPSQTENTRISRMPMRKGGSETPTRLKVSMARLSQELR